MGYEKKHILLFLLLYCCQVNSAAVSYSFSGGRFGDNLVAYLHAKWISYTHKIPLLYYPFPYSDELMMHTLEKRINDNALNKGKVLTQSPEIFKNINDLETYIVPYFSECLYEHDIVHNGHWIYFKVDWDDQNFHKEICKTIFPQDKSLLDFELPSNCPTLAIHMRTGKLYDRDLGQRNPLKSPPLEFYIQQIEYLLDEIDAPYIYTYLFTDDPEPKDLAEKILHHLKDNSRIILEYREKDNSHDQNVLRDFFAMTKFDYMINPLSSFSMVVGRIGRPLIQIMPKKFKKISMDVAPDQKLASSSQMYSLPSVMPDKRLAAHRSRRREYRRVVKRKNKKNENVRQQPVTKSDEKIVITEVEIIRRERW
ncbi:MAG: hypothetical protein WD068_03565 [Candidatus Babeliales bacterium]